MLLFLIMTKYNITFLQGQTGGAKEKRCPLTPLPQNTWQLGLIKPFRAQNSSGGDERCCT